MIATWEGQSGVPVESRTLCLQMEVVVTNERGIFKLSDSSGSLNPFVVNRQRSIGFYKPGYRSVDQTDDFKTLFVEARKETSPKDFDAVWRAGFRSASCDGNQKALLPLLKALAKELQPIAQTPKQRARTGDLLFNIETIEFGDEIAMRNLNTRMLEERKGRRR